MLNVNRERICSKESERIRVKELKCEVSNGGNLEKSNGMEGKKGGIIFLRRIVTFLKMLYYVDNCGGF